MSAAAPSVAASALLFLLPAAVVLALLEPTSLGSAAGRSAGGYLPTLGRILATNLPTALFLFAGVVCLGASAVVGTVIAGFFFGFSVNAALGTFGAGYVLEHCWLYTPLELYGFVLASASGLVVLQRVLLAGEGPFTAFRRSKDLALRLLGHALLLLVLSAAIEAAFAS